LATCPVTRSNHKELTMHATSIVNSVDLGRLSETIDTVWAVRNCRHVGPARRGAGSMPATRRI